MNSTDFLVPTSGFILGMATIANLSGNFYAYNKSATPLEADARALRSDFSMVGQDLFSAMKKAKNESPQMEFPLAV